MDLVVDANILFAALIKQSTTRTLLFLKHLHLFAPDFILEELAKYKEEILRKTGKSEQAFFEILNRLRNRLFFIAKEDLLAFKDRVMEFTPDIKDWPYFAAALKIGAEVWSNDSHMKNQDQISVVTTSELLGRLGDIISDE